MTDIINRRFGKLTISQHLGDEPMIHTVFKQLAFFPWHAEFKPEANCFYMMGTSPMFREVPQGHPAPDYSVMITQVDDDNIVIAVREQRVREDGNYTDPESPALTVVENGD